MGSISEAMQFTGPVRFNDLIPNAGAIRDSHVASGADVDAAKLKHRRTPTYAQPNTTATAVTQVVYEVYGTTGTLIAFRAGSIVPCVGGASVTVDLKKNGTTVLSAVITLDNANTAYISEAGTLNVTTLAAGDVLTIVTTAAAGGGTIATGLWAQVVLDELAQ